MAVQVTKFSSQKRPVVMLSTLYPSKQGWRPSRSFWFDPGFVPELARLVALAGAVARGETKPLEPSGDLSHLFPKTQEPDAPDLS